MTNYFELYAGPGYGIQAKYSFINKICFICFMFGPGIPILFPIGLAALSITYCTDRYAIAKHYRMPPNFDDQLNYICIRDLLWSPFLYCGIGFWMFTN